MYNKFCVFFFFIKIYYQCKFLDENHEIFLVQITDLNNRSSNECFIMKKKHHKI